MIAKQSVYLDMAKTKAVVEGHPEARFMLARVGTEVPEKVAELYEGATALLNSAQTKPVPPGVQTPPAPVVRTPAVSTKAAAPAPAAKPSKAPRKPKAGAKGSKPAGDKPAAGEDVFRY